ncbi:MAG: type I restriction enzyme HsdR N-terminal domain-containing protein [Ignavibacteriales bacterium]|nr:type I restriction enzyme HsdR N-terminal domain-containing protein [Ignavibacteriales bacterium]
MQHQNSTLFANFDFTQLNSPDFKEDSVREVIILPILNRLGYDDKNIVRSKSLLHPFLKIGSKKRPVNVIPDYLLKVTDYNYAWVLDAKSPTEEIKTGDNVEQIFSYAIHPEIRTKYFALCNGKEFVLFRQDTERPLIYFDVSEINRYWERLETYLSPDSFQIGKTISYSTVREGQISYDEDKFDYLNRPLLNEIKVQKQAAKRHFGVHGYFTKQAWNVVRTYINNFSKPGDLVLDPFGGSGVTAVEALMTDRKAIHIDLNPMSVFIVENMIAPVEIHKLSEAFDRVKNSFEKDCPTTKAEIKKALQTYPYPKGFQLPGGSDVPTIEKLFSEKQLAQLAFLKHLILKEKNENIRKSLLLAFSSTLTVSNLTTHAGESGGPNSGAFAYYRYRIAKKPSEFEVINSFESKFKRVLAAKKEVEVRITEDTISNGQIIKGTATDLHWIKSESVDYIYTDPPYGKKIPYLDLSVMWNAWLDLDVTEEDYQQEAIEGGERNKTKDQYSSLISQSIQEMFRVLKFDRWMSFVFAHKDPEFWHLILDTAERAGFEYAGAVKQANGQTSFKKRQNPFTVLSGQLIINFKKVRKPKTILKANLGMNISDIVMQTIEGIIAKNNGASLEQINDELIIKGLELGFLDLLKKEYTDLTPLLLDSFDYNDETETFHIRLDKRFTTHIDINLRIQYYLISFLRRQQLENKTPAFDEIIFHIMPLLRNGVTPEKQTILNVLEDIAERIGLDCWQLKRTGQLKLFM